MKTLQFSDFAQHPLLQTNSIDGVLSYFYVSAQSQLLGQEMPLVNVNSDKVTMDYDKVQMGGMTPAVSAGSESPIYATSGRGQREWNAAEFREKVILHEQELMDLRKLGTDGDLEGARSLLARKYAALQVRLANRIEWMRRQVLFDKKVVAETAGGAPLVVDYEHPAYLEPTAAVLWDNPAADPLGDLQLWAEEFRTNTGYDIKKVVLPHGTLRILTANTKFQTIAQGNWMAMNGSQEAVRQELSVFLGVGDVQESNNRINFLSELMVDAAGAQPVINLRYADQLAAGDEIIIRSTRNFSTEKHTVASVSGTSVTLTANLAGPFQFGDVVRYHKFIIPQDKILILGSPMTPADAAHASELDKDKLNVFADVASTLSRYSSFDNPTPGFFTKLIDRIADGDPPHIEQILGIRALPRVHYQDGWMTPKIR